MNAVILHGAPDGVIPDVLSRPCHRCGGYSNDRRHDSLMHCNTYCRRAGRGPCPKPSDHHTYQPW